MNNVEMEKLKPVSLSENINLYSHNIYMNEIKSDLRMVIINIISFILLYFSFTPLSSYFFPISYFLYPIDFISFIFLLISSIISSYTLILTISYRINYFHTLYNILFYIILFFVHHSKIMGGNSFDKSFIYFYIFIFLNIQNICLYYIYHKIIEFYELYNEQKENSENYYPENKLNIKNFLNLILLIIILILMHTLLEIKKEKIFNCDKWDIGLNGTKVNDNSENICQMKKPKGYCKMDYFKGYFDLTPFNNRNCSKRDAEKEKKYFMKNLKNNKNIDDSTEIFGFPYTNIDKKFSLKNQKNVETFGLLVNNDIFDLNKTKKYKNLKPETVLDFSKYNSYKGKYGELKINLNYNEILSKKRKFLEKRYSLYNNILMIYLDATSRSHFQRSFPKLSNFIKNFMSYSPLSVKKIKSYQYMKYHSFGAFTPINIIPMFYGNSMQSNKGIHNVKYFKKNGFITGHVVDMCNKEQYDISLNENDQKEYEEWDHENVAYLCDGNYFEINDPYPNDRGAFSNKERCLYGNPVSHYMIEYTKQFWEKYYENKKYFRIAFNYGHEKTGAVISYLDEPLYQMIYYFYNKGFLDKTALFIVSDHGNQNGGVYDVINSSEFEIEKKYGVFFLLLYQDENIMDNFGENLLKNQQVMLTPYDIHDTLIHILYGNNMDNTKKIYSVNNKGNSVFKFINQTERNCEKYDEWDKDFCGCV